MKLQRVFRDVGILAILCLAFYAMISVVSQMGDNDENSLFSRNRIMADRHYRAKEWPAAIQYYRALIEEDPFNGLAWSSMAYSYLALRVELNDDIQDAIQNSESEEQLESLYEQASLYEEEAIAAYLESCNFLRYRRQSLLNLALVYVLRSEWELAMDSLETYLDEGNYTNQGIDFFRQYGRGGPAMVNGNWEDEQRVRLHQFPRFWELVERERDLRDQPVQRRNFPF